MELKGHTIGFKGEYSATVLKADGTVKEFLNEEKTLRSGDVIKNLLLDNFFELLISVENPLPASGALFSIRCGTGTSPVNTSQSSLQSQLSLTSGAWPANIGVSHPNSVLDGGVVKSEIVSTFTFSVGQIVGNISELGVNMTQVQTASNTLIHSRALVVDNLGNPTTITVTSEEQLIINYTLKSEMSSADAVQTVDMLINGVPTPVEVTARRIGLPRLQALAFSRLGTSSTGASAVSSGTLSSPGTFVNIGNPGFSYNVSGGKQTNISANISQGNVAGGIGVMRPGDANSWCLFGFNPPLPKTSDRTLFITIRQTFGRLP